MVKEIIKEYKQPLSIYFIYHPNLSDETKKCIKFCYDKLQRDIDKPFSRFINIPVFYKTSNSENEIPKEFEPRSEKAIIFLLIDNNVVLNDDWLIYYTQIYNKMNDNGYCVIPVAIDEAALHVNTYSQLNCIRAYKFKKSFYKEKFLLQVTNAIYSWILNKKKCEFGKEKNLKIFLSHTKVGQVGEKVAKQIKNFIDNTILNNFFDRTDLAINYEFNEEIINHIKDSVILLINSDPYLSRYWCQKEILAAKENNRPIVAIDCLSKYEDRYFPHAANIPTIHLKSEEFNNISTKTLYMITLTLLLETLRHYYNTMLLESYRDAKFIPKDSEILSRPPELLDINKMINSKEKYFIYPEPEIFNIEKDIFSQLEIKVTTPLNYNIKFDLSNINIGISISDPEEDAIVEVGQYKEHLIQLSMDLAKNIIARNGNLIYGGDLRQNGFTEYIIDAAKILYSDKKYSEPHIKNYIVYPIYKNDDEKVKKWKADHKRYAKMENVKIPKSISEMIENKNETTSVVENNYIWSVCLTGMRKSMIKECDYRIAAGGKFTNYKGIMPGVLEEILIAVDMKKPLYLLGGFGGVVSDVCKIMTISNTEKLTKNLQKEKNSNYELFLNYLKENHKELLPDYKDFTEKLKIENLHNGLDENDNLKLFSTPFVDEAIFLIMKGLKQVNNKNS